jgi:hypothetical protein
MDRIPNGVVVPYEAVLENIRLVVEAVPDIVAAVVEENAIVARFETIRLVVEALVEEIAVVEA